MRSTGSGTVPIRSASKARTFRSGGRYVPGSAELRAGGSKQKFARFLVRAAEFARGVWTLRSTSERYVP